MKLRRLKIIISFVELSVCVLYFNFIDLNAQDLSLLTKNDQCINCHLEEEIMPEDFLEYDIHMQAGLSCAGCHGGDPSSDDEDIAMSNKKDFIGLPTKEEIPQFCGKCHSDIKFMRTYQPRITTDQVDKYYTSIHGKNLKAGDKKVAVCVSCHSAHGILSSKDPRSTVYPINVPQTCRKCHSNPIYMKDSNLPTNQYEVYVLSVHGKALLENKDIGAPACNDCHGNHGAMPPGTASVSHICGSCHIHNLEYFSASAMSKAFEQFHFHGCEQCHGSHEIQKTNHKMVGISQASFCTKCHTVGEKGYEEARVINAHITDLVSLYDSANTKLRNVQVKGMNDIEIGFLLQDSKQSLILSRTLVHTFNADKVFEKSNDGIKKSIEAINLANKEIESYYDRRFGFAFSTVAFLILAIALYFKIRGIEKPNPEK